MSRNRSGSLQSAIDRLRKAEAANYRDLRIRSAGSPGNGVAVTTVILGVLLVASLPFWQSLPDWGNSAIFGKQQPSVAPLQAPAFIVGYAIALGLNTIKALYNVR